MNLAFIDQRPTRSTPLLKTKRALHKCSHATNDLDGLISARGIYPCASVACSSCLLFPAI